MKRLIVILSVLALCGCTAMQGPVVLPKWPDAPSDLQQPAADLTPLAPEQRNLSDLILNSNENYSQYYILKEKYEGWQSWYNSQKQIFGGLQK